LASRALFCDHPIVTSHLCACSCQPEALPCAECRDAAVGVAAAVSAAYDGKHAHGVNEIEFADLHGGRVYLLRREADGAWQVSDVRPLGSAERDRARPQPTSA
jgi:hypothetical protein